MLLAGLWISSACEELYIPNLKNGKEEMLHSNLCSEFRDLYLLLGAPTTEIPDVETVAPKLRAEGGSSNVCQCHI